MFQVEDELKGQETQTIKEQFSSIEVLYTEGYSKILELEKKIANFQGKWQN